MRQKQDRLRNDDARTMEREKLTLTTMIRIYCQAHHETGGELCGTCDGLRLYALERLNRCPFGVGKPTCAKCSIHCYKPRMRERIREVMRFAGPRMLSRHPLLTIRHIVDASKRRQ